MLKRTWEKQVRGIAPTLTVPAGAPHNDPTFASTEEVVPRPSIIRKDSAANRVTPNWTDYEGLRAAFSWAAARRELAGTPQGGLNIAIAVNQKDADKALADKKELEAIMIKLQKQMDEGEQELKKIIQEIQDSIQAVSKMLAGATDSMQQITSNIGKRAPV